MGFDHLLHRYLFKAMLGNVTGILLKVFPLLLHPLLWKVVGIEVRFIIASEKEEGVRVLDAHRETTGNNTSGREEPSSEE